ncbi:hypothetical protein PMZ80_001176 [Knufia obscura]|uniref:Uncharacterized protein n=2 Tax=Knufia TaxID=430999 RepID=A0AAN8ICM0_9EURO|nr:hypothetical protein PMZ80_001176 [Knufia obscura]KAK5958760.1 hypothetical protein OHC33_000603 [Knufia fluminis]
MKPAPDLIPKSTRDTEADKLILRLKCRHVTPCSLAASQLPIEIAQQISNVLASRADQELAYEFNTLLLHEQDPAVRLRLLQSSQVQGQALSSPQGFRTFVRNIVGGLYDIGHQVLATTLVTHLIRGRDIYELDEDDLSLGQHLDHISNTPAKTKFPTPEPDPTCPNDRLIWVDRYNLPIDPQTTPETQRHFADRSEAEAKKTVLEYVFGGPIVRWNAQDHAAGLYGDPSDIGVSSSTTGWVVQRGNDSARRHQEQRDKQEVAAQTRIDEYFRQTRPSPPSTHHLAPEGADSQPAQNIEYGVYPNDFDVEFARMDAEAAAEAEAEVSHDNPPLPILPSDDSWMDGIDDFIAQLYRGVPPTTDHATSPD